jgi:hypothetical protein
VTRVNSGADLQAAVMGGDLAGLRGTATASSATSLTDSGASFGTFTGHLVVAGSTGANLVYGVITSNTGTVLTVDRWYDPASPGGTAGSTPAATAPYIVLPGGAPAWYMALSTNASAPAAGDTTLTGEITTAGGGLIRKIAAYAHTGGAASYTLTATFTANGSDSLPATNIHKIGVFNSLTGGRMVFETVLNADATMSASGDALTVTETVSL